MVDASARGPDRFDVAIAGGGLAGRTPRARARQARPARLSHRAGRRRAGARRRRRRPRAGADRRHPEPAVRARSLARACALGASRSRRSRSPTARWTPPCAHISSASMPSSRTVAPRRISSSMAPSPACLPPRWREPMPSTLFAPDSVTDYAADAFKVVLTLGTGEMIDAASARRRRRQTLATARAGRHQMRWLVLSANRHRHYRGACAPASWQGGAAFSSRPGRSPCCRCKATAARSCGPKRRRAAKPIMALDEADFIAELAKRFGAQARRDHACGSAPILSARPSDRARLHRRPARADRRCRACRASAGGAGAQYRHARRCRARRDDRRGHAARARYRLPGDRSSATQRWRRFDSAFSAAVMDGLNRLFSNDSAPLRTLRDLGLGLVDRAPPLKRFLVREAAGATGTVPRC